MKKLIIYDLDGTLVDTREDIANAANQMLRDLGLATHPQNVIERFVGYGVHHFIAHCMQTQDPKRIEQGIKVYRRHYHEHMLDHTRLYPGAKDILEYFKDRFQAVITNKPDPFSVEILKALGVAGYFFHIVAGDSGYPKKPDPASVQDLMRMKKVGPADTLFVGDSLIDLETARNAGVASAIITHGFVSADELKSANPERLFSNFREMLDEARKNQW
ncbi:MAG: HAD-IA family hydrolase [Candidatus Omnitrophica bacterium]|nr:HAD-IA family hydrolase [Candidatus Omnitrophota bacterium]MDD5671015.1 HAD-IA family hydrolase [Candidatus Omnitrophota bacterium]